MDDYEMYDEWSVYYDPQAYAAANFSAFDNLPLASPSDPRMTADVTVAKEAAIKKGNNGLANTLDFILKYGDRALSILSKNGIIKNQNLVAAGYTNYTVDDAKADSVSKAPVAENRVFNVDFSDPKVLIIVFLLLTGLVYFLFFNDKGERKK